MHLQREAKVRRSEIILTVCKQDAVSVSITVHLLSNVNLKTGPLLLASGVYRGQMVMFNRRTRT